MRLFISETDIELRALQLVKFMYIFGNDIKDPTTCQDFRYG